MSLTRIVEALFILSMAVRSGFHDLGHETKGIRIERALSQDIAYFSGGPLLQELSIIFLDTAIKYSPRDTLVQANVEKAEGQLHINPPNLKGN